MAFGFSRAVSELPAKDLRSTAHSDESRTGEEPRVR
jgi:hypothetical protein